MLNLFCKLLIKKIIDSSFLRIFRQCFHRFSEPVLKTFLEIFGKDGGFVFATVHNAQSDVPPENFITMWETFREFRNY
jgi:hypothetical protein